MHVLVILILVVLATLAVSGGITGAVLGSLISKVPLWAWLIFAILLFKLLKGK